MIIPIFRGEIKNGQLVLNETSEYETYIASLDGNKIELTVKKLRKVRSERQNKYYWGVVLKLISEHTGEESEDLHNHFSYKYLSKAGKSGQLHSRKSTTKLSTAEFTEYIDKIIHWGERYLKIRFPDPDDVEYDFTVN